MHIVLWRKWREYSLRKSEAVRPSPTFWMLLNPWNFKFYIIWRRLLPRWTVACGSGKSACGSKSASTFPPTILISVMNHLVDCQPWEIWTPTPTKVPDPKLLLNLLCNSYFLIGKHTNRQIDRQIGAHMCYSVRGNADALAWGPSCCVPEHHLSPHVFSLTRALRADSSPLHPCTPVHRQNCVSQIVSLVTQTCE